MTHPESLTNHLRALLLQAQAGRHRYPVVLSGEGDWCRELVTEISQRLSLTDALWISDPSLVTADAVLPASQAGKVLGREFDLLVFDGHAGFDPDAFGAVTGTIRGGGLLLLLTPELGQWPAFDDPEHDKLVAPYRRADVKGRFLSRMVRVIEADDSVVLIRQGEPLPPLPKAMPAAIAPPVDDGACRTADQEQAVTAIIHVLSGHRRRPLVLDSDRGRGKSSALGIAAARLLQQGVSRVIVTGPRLAAVAPVFEHAQQLLPGCEASPSLIHWQAGRIEFLPPDGLIQNSPAADLLLVDEAAAIPTPMLERLLTRYSRIVFATTVHGYEGTGRGFELRFKRMLERRTPGWRQLRLETPIRWAGNDPLEHFVFRALLLDSGIVDAGLIARTGVEPVHIEKLDRDALLRDETLLARVFGLLVIAHYRTSPSDLRNLLDAPNLSLFVLRRGKQLLATALVSAEGGFSPELARQVYRGQRRLRGHLLAQSLAAHAGLEDAPCRRLARVMRIAVHPAAQRQGLGMQLLNALIDWARSEEFDAIGASFGASEGLLRFWRRCSLQPVRLGFKREHSSGEYSALLMKPLTKKGESLFQRARQGFIERFPHELSDPLRQLDPLLAVELLCHGERPAQDLNEQDRRDIEAFASYRRGYEVSLVPLWRFCRIALAEGKARELLAEKQQALLVAKVMQKRPWPELVSLLDFQGKATAIEALRQAIRCLLASDEDGK